MICALGWADNTARLAARLPSRQAGARRLQEEIEKSLRELGYGKEVAPGLVV